jgi:hypothetical protein
VSNAQVLAVERQAIARAFAGSRPAYLAALAQAGATLGIARDVIRDELRRRALAAKLRASGTAVPPLQWIADRTAQALSFTICRKDDLPGSGDFPRSDARDVGVVPLAGLLPFLFDDHTPPAAPPAPVATPGPATVTLAWTYAAPDPDLAGWEVLRAAQPGGPYTKLTVGLLDRPAYADHTAPPKVPAYYVLRAVDSSGNESASSPEVAAAPA